MAVKLKFTGERIVPGATDVEPAFQRKMLQEHLARYLFASHFSSGKRVIDLGCGTGYGVDFLLKHSDPDEIIGIDIAKEAIDFARTNYKNKKAKFLVADATNLPFDNHSFDLVLAFELIEHLDNPEMLVKEAKRILKKRGFFIVSTPKRKRGKRSIFHKHEFSFLEFSSLLKNYFPQVKFLVENNIFASLINEGKTLGKIIDNQDGFKIPGLEDGDYFIAICALDKLPSLPENTLFVNNDDYILRLEHDVQVLREAENRLKEEKRSLIQQLEDYRVKIDNLVRENTYLSEMNALSKEKTSFLERRNKRLVSKINSFKEKLERTQELQSRVNYLEGELNNYRVILDRITSSKGWKLLRLYYLIKELFIGKPEDPYYNLFFRGKRILLKAIEIYRQRGWKGVIKSGKRFLFRKLRLDKIVTSRRDEESLFSSVQRRSKLPSSNFSVCIISGCEGTGAEIHRVFHLAEVLELANIRHKIIPHSKLNEYLSSNEGVKTIFDYDIFYIHRAAWNESLEKLLRGAKRFNRLIIYDIDDLVFDQKIIPFVRVIADWPEEKKSLYRESVIRYWRAMDWADYFVAPTDFLANYIRKMFDRPAFVLRNHLDLKTAQIGNKLIGRLIKKKERVVIGYMSGTATHDRDFQEASGALIKILEKFPQVELKIIGPLNLDKKFRRFSSRIRKVKLVPFYDLLREMEDFDINLAPLEVGNPYCEAKSELKYFFAAILGIPTVASATDSYKFAITHGKNGFLATNENDWYQALSRLVQDSSLRRRIGDQARKQVKFYLPDNQKNEVVKVIRKIVNSYNKDLTSKKKVSPQNNGSLIINFVLPEPLKASGGHAVVFRLSEQLTSWGHKVNIYFVKVDGNDFIKNEQELELFVRENNLRGKANFYLGLDKIEHSDALVATYWKTAYMIKEINNTKRKFYLTMDFEPLFYPAGSAYLMAENSYKLGYYHIATGYWIPKLLKKRYGVPAEGIDIATDKNIYFPRNVERVSPSVAFFARPRMPRRGFELGIEALRIVKEKKPEVQIFLYGDRNFSEFNIPFEYHDCKILPEDKLAELFSRVDVSLSISLSNPSVIALQAMHCGCAAVEIDYPTNDGTYINNLNCLLAPPHPRGIAETVLKLLDNKKLRREIAQRGLQWANGISYEKTTRQFLRIIKRELKRAEKDEKKESQNNLSSTISLPDGWY